MELLSIHQFEQSLPLQASLVWQRNGSWEDLDLGIQFPDPKMLARKQRERMSAGTDFVHANIFMGRKKICVRKSLLRHPLRRKRIEVESQPINLIPVDVESGKLARSCSILPHALRYGPNRSNSID